MELAAHQTIRVEDRTLKADNFDAVVNLYWPVVFRFALASLRDREAAKTVAQDCFVKAYRGLATFRGDASVKTWLMQIAVNLVRDHARNRRLQFWRRLSAESGVISDLPDESINPERRALVSERVQQIWNASRLLPERQRTVFLLRFVEEMQLLEINGTHRRGSQGPLVSSTEEHTSACREVQ
jgi:RNA polymerase sigma-70 factor, ECF subfamily